MANHGARQQKRLAKKKAQPKEKRNHVARESSAPVLVRARPDWPVVEALIPIGLFEHGIGHLLLARQAPEGNIAVSVFLVDTYCMGVKDCFSRMESPYGYRNFKYGVDQIERLVAVTPEKLAKIVLGSVEHAAKIGLDPHPDFDLVQSFLAGIDPTACPEEIPFGRDGKPLYMQGPHESAVQAAEIMHRVNEAGGTFIVPVRPGDEVPGTVHFLP